MKKLSSATLWLVALIVIILVAVAVVGESKSSNTLTVNEFEKAYKEEKLKSMEISEDRMIVTGLLKDNRTYQAVVPYERLLQIIEKYPDVNDIQETYIKPTSVPFWIQYLPTILLIVMLVAFWFLFMQQSQGGGAGRGVMNFGKSRAKMASPDKKKVTFADVAGADEEKAELAEIVDFLKNPKKYTDMGARIPKGVLLVGPPGTGKTLLAKAVSGEAGVPFFSISGSDFVEMFVGVGASRVRDLFEQAKKHPSSIVFIDEIDAVGRQRGAGLGGGHDEREQTLNQLLVEMDGFGVNEGIIIIAATNRPDILDPALLRPGRFDRQIVVAAPDVKGREEILKVHSRNKKLENDIRLDVLAKSTSGFTGADLENLMNEAALLAVRNNKKSIGQAELEEAVTRVVAGPEKKSRVIHEYDKKITAYHEAGHAIVAKLLPNADPVHQISIIPRGMAAGYTMSLPKDDKTHVSKGYLLDQMVVLLGGRAAEKLALEDICTGAQNDIERATAIARKMVMEYGMSDEIGPMSLGTDQNEVFLGRDIGRGRNFSEEVASVVDREIKKLIDDSYNKALKLLEENMNKLHAVAQALLEKEKLEANEFEEIYNATV
ncbi:ATP-dependent zinc metalloprotease FtsH [Clostridium sp. N3C]|uniref:ATP-dependent zinc metalloprotease FtsH n=1 Tax=Clostridium sp. N3C TaxID=1776758 RepID=UPI00092DFC4C|nr:ATP-dependent zinc metalloprotease FtsH [Clostridium sp. N3C]SCN23148.1 ATP-dependent zinc metalloprotease FtsH [Clostridium sp. N3C]